MRWTCRCRIRWFSDPPRVPFSLALLPRQKPRETLIVGATWNQGSREEADVEGLKPESSGVPVRCESRPLWYNPQRQEISGTKIGALPLTTRYLLEASQAEGIPEIQGLRFLPKSGTLATSTWYRQSRRRSAWVGRSIQEVLGESFSCSACQRRPAARS